MGPDKDYKDLQRQIPYNWIVLRSTAASPFGKFFFRAKDWFYLECKHCGHGRDLESPQELTKVLTEILSFIQYHLHCKFLTAVEEVRSQQSTKKK